MPGGWLATAVEPGVGTGFSRKRRCSNVQRGRSSARKLLRMLCWSLRSGWIGPEPESPDFEDVTFVEVMVGGGR